MADYAPTTEQQTVIDACQTGENLVVEAAAGAGKTSTLRMSADTMNGRILYVAYNKAAATEAQQSFPAHVKCSTVHALAFAAGGRHYSARLRAPRQSAKHAAEQLEVRNPVEIGSSLILTPTHITRLALGTVQRFCQSADDEISDRHLAPLLGLPTQAELGRWHREIPQLRAEGDHQAAAELHTLWDNGLRSHRDLAEAVLPIARKAWADLQSPHGNKVRFEHDHYLKMWQLRRPVLPYDVVMLDEAQDSNPVTADIVTRQQGQRIAIGDGCQQLYAWRGAVDALATWPAELRLFLTQSWRFGQAVADEANKWLSLIGTPMRVVGNPNLPSEIRMLSGLTPSSKPDAVLCRSNAGAVARVMAALEAGQLPALVGGANDLVRLAEAAAELQTSGRTSHPELFVFKSWGEVQEYANEESGQDLRVFVNLVDEHGPHKIIGALSQTVDESTADVVVSTAHRSKGREWNHVLIANDYAEPKPQDGLPGVVEKSDAMLAYVAVTRARLVLDRGGLAWVDRYAINAARTAARKGVLA